MKEEEIVKLSKTEYKKKVTKMVKKAAFKYFLKEKDGHKKIKDLVYKDLNVQTYLTSKIFNNEERNLLYSLISRCHPAKNNFQKMNKNNLLCSLGCSKTEDQFHVFMECPYLTTQTKPYLYENIFKGVEDQKELIITFLEKDKIRKYLKEKLLPGESQDPS